MHSYLCIHICIHIHKTDTYIYIDLYTHIQNYACFLSMSIYLDINIYTHIYRVLKKIDIISQADIYVNSRSNFFSFWQHAFKQVKIWCFFLNRYRDVLHWKIKGVLCVGVCSITVEQDCVAFICQGVVKADADCNADLDMAHKIQSGRLFVQEKRIWTMKNIRRDNRACL